MSKRDYYEVLGVSRSATESEIKRAYLKLAKKHHPDQNSGDAQSEKKFKEISSAYDVLKDPQKRASYDRFGHDTPRQGSSSHGTGQNFHGHDVNDIFNDFFGDFMGASAQRSKRRSTSVRGADLKYNLSITLNEAFKGVNKKISFKAETGCGECSGTGSNDGQAMPCNTCRGSGTIRMQQGFFAVEQTCSNCNGAGQIIRNPCRKCHGSGRYKKQKDLVVNIPSGIENGTRIRIAGEGEAGVRSGSAGDLYVFISVKSHDIYRVEDADLHFTLPITFTKAALGGEVDISTIDGAKVKLKIPAGTETGNKIRLKSCGMSKVRSSSRGDLYAHINVKIPKKLNTKQKTLLEELDRELRKDNNYHKEEEGFFSKMKNIWS